MRRRPRTGSTIRNELDVQITVARQRLKGASAMKLDVRDQALHPGVIGFSELGDDAASTSSYLRRAILGMVGAIS